MSRDDKQLPTPPPETGQSKYGVLDSSKHIEGESSRLASGSSATSGSHAKRTTYGSGTNMLRKFDTNDDLLIRLLAQKALTESQGYQILTQEEIDDLKNEQDLLRSLIESTNRKLQLEQKVKQAARSLYRLENAANKRQRISSLPTASSQLNTAQQKCEEINAELWRLSSLSTEIERKLLNHNAAVLGLGMNILEKKAMEVGMLDDFGEGHLYLSSENSDYLMKRFSTSSRTLALPAELSDAQNRLRDLNSRLTEITHSDTTTVEPDNILSHIDQLEKSIDMLTTSHTNTTETLQTSLSESQRMIDQLKLRERDQSAAIHENTNRMEDLKRRLTQTQKEFDRAQNELDERDIVIENLKQEFLASAIERVSIAESAAQAREAENLKREKNLRKADADKFNSEISRLNSEAMQKETIIEELTRNFESIQAQHESAQEDVVTLQSKVDEHSRQHSEVVQELEAQLITLKSDNANLKAERDEILGSRQQRAEEARLQRELEEQREKLSSVVQSNNNLLREIQELESCNSQLTHDLEISQSDRVAIEESLTRQISSLEEQLAEKVDPSEPSHEKQLEDRCVELENELSSILDDFERLTSQFIDHESFRQTLESQVDALHAQCHTLQTELAVEKVRCLGRNGDAHSPIQGNNEPTSTTTLRNEFRKMVAEMRNEHIATLKAEYDERRKLEAIVREMKKDKDRERYAAGKNSNGR